MYPIDVARPMVTATKISRMSSALYCMLLNLTKPKAPATAIPVPTLPLTIMMTVWATTGIRISVI